MTIWKKYPAAVNWNVSADGLLFGFLVGLNEIVMMSLKLFCFILLRFYDTKKLKNFYFGRTFAMPGRMVQYVGRNKTLCEQVFRVPLSAKIACLVEASCVLSLPELNFVVQHCILDWGGCTAAARSRVHAACSFAERH